MYHISTTKIAKSAKRSTYSTLSLRTSSVPKKITGFEEADTWAKLLLVASYITLQLSKKITPP